MFISPCSQKYSLKHFRAKVPISKIHGHMLEIFDIRFLSITPLLDRCGPNCCASEKEVFPVHHGNSAYIQVPDGIYENSSSCMANSPLGQRAEEVFCLKIVQWGTINPAADREDMFVFSMQGLALFKWSCHFLQKLKEMEWRKWGRWLTSCCRDTPTVNGPTTLNQIAVD